MTAARPGEEWRFGDVLRCRYMPDYRVMFIARRDTQSSFVIFLRNAAVLPGQQGAGALMAILDSAYWCVE